MNLKIFFSQFILLLTSNALYNNQQKVYSMTDQEEMKNLAQLTHDETETETETYFNAIEETFDLYYRDKKYKNGKVCKSGQKKEKDIINSYESLKALFDRNCSYIIGNLVISDIIDQDISFLNSIEEVSGYVMFFNNGAESISLNNLKVIRGESPIIIKGSRFALAFANNNKGNKSMKYVLMPSLQVIRRHNVLFYENNDLCHTIRMINWDSLLGDDHKVVIVQGNNESCSGDKEGVDLQCHPSCQKHLGRQFCWNDSRFSCQKINDCIKRSCSTSNKCYKNENLNTEECCHDECSGGCTGPHKNQCLACKNFNNNGNCVENCPPLEYYNGVRYVPNPQGKLAFNHICVDKCPVKFFSEKGNCVPKCTLENTYSVNQTCLPCPNQVCPKICRSADLVKNKDVHFLHRKLLDLLENCTVYDGNIEIDKLSIEGDPFYELPRETHGIRHEDLLKLEKLTEIHGHLKISTQDSAPWFKSLSYFRNLKTIRAETIRAAESYGLRITHNDNLLYLDLSNLKEVRNGDIVIGWNKKLCFTDSLTSASILHNKKMIIGKNGYNVTCKRKCHKECHKNYGCWGPLPLMCVKCLNFVADGPLCTRDCDLLPGYFYNVSQNSMMERKCSKCHPECVSGKITCNGTDANQCNFGCKNNVFLGYCVSKCPSKHFNNSLTQNVCKPCHSTCTDNNLGEQICTGQGNFIGINGCNWCNYIQFQLNETSTEINSSSSYRLICLSDIHVCPKGYFKYIVDFRSSDKFVRLQSGFSNITQIKKVLNWWIESGINRKLAKASVCLPCHPSCLECSDGSQWQCSRCKHFRSENKCVNKCASESFIRIRHNKNETEKECEKCHDECNEGCFGPSEYSCKKCRHAKIIINETTNEFFCNSTCGDKSQVFVKSEILCVDGWRYQKLTFYHYVGGSMIITLFVIMSCIVVACIRSCVEKKKAIDKKIKYLTNFYDIDTETNTGVLPNMATLLLITESQLTREEIIGSGAFGIVYKGVWQPNIDTIDNSSSFLKRNLMKLSQDTSIKLLVAIKVLTDISDPANNRELLEEAKVMASVNHACCLRILAVCLTAHPKLITQFMPLGCLLEFCQKYRSQIKNISLLIWAKQIACGMEYLESKGIIHCDLAARNVLVESPRQVKITDFGLAKMLDYSQHQYQFKGGRMPIKWLAIECIRSRIFSSKSDVWSYGVTLWEMFTFGEKPFADIKAYDILDHLDKGQRLNQPKICSIDAYTILIQCWLVDPEARPSFTELRKTFETMAENPNRYLLIQDSEDSSSFHADWENDAQKYDEFLQALVKASYFKADNDPTVLKPMQKKYIRSVRNRYREMQTYKNCFMNNENYCGTQNLKEQMNSDNPDYTKILFSDNCNSNQTGSTWTDYCDDGAKRVSNCTTVTHFISSVHERDLNKILETDLSEDGYLIPDSVNKKPNCNYTSQANKESSDIIYSCEDNLKTAEKETLINHESSL